jgi:hypothetical protein
VIFCVCSFSAKVAKYPGHDSEYTVIEKGNIRYDAEGMVLHDGGSRYSGERGPVAYPAQSGLWLFLTKATRASQNQERVRKMGRTNHLDVYLHLPDSKPGRENAMKARSESHHSHIDGLCFAYRTWSCLGRTRSPAYSRRCRIRSSMFERWYRSCSLISRKPML